MQKNDSNDGALNEIESDFVEFFSELNQEPRDAIVKAYLAAKHSMDLAGDEYRNFTLKTTVLYAPYRSDRSEKAAIESYRQFAYLDMLRFVSYSFPKPSQAQRYGRALYRVARGDFRPLRKLFSLGKAAREKTLEDFLDGPRAIVDYGSGGGYRSFKLAQKYPGTRVTLVDIDSISLDFTAWRFKKHGIPTEVIRVTSERVYPALPAHDVCIANEVMEHLHRPTAAFNNIDEALRPGGILCGNFDDHGRELFHVSADLGALRERLRKGYEPIAPHIYRKSR